MISISEDSRTAGSCSSCGGLAEHVIPVRSHLGTVSRVCLCTTSKVSYTHLLLGVIWLINVTEVKGVQQVLDQEEEVAMAEFARFEEELKKKKGGSAPASSGGKGTLDSVE